MLASWIFSPRLSVESYGVRLAEHLDRHKIRPSTLEAWALRFREVVVDMRAVRARRLHEYAFEFEPRNEGVQELKRICREANEWMHVDSLGFLQADFRHFRFRGGVTIWGRCIFPIFHLVLAIGVKLVLELQQRVHVLVQTLWAHPLVVIREKAVHLVDLVVHLLCFCDRLHDVHQVHELNLALVSLVVMIDQFLDLVIW